MNRQSVVDLEKTVISFLAGRPLSEVCEYVDQLSLHRWTSDSKKAINIILECISLGEENISGSLIAKYRPASVIAKILSVFVPIHVGKQAIKDLSEIQLAQEYQEKLAAINKLPISERGEKLRELSDNLARGFTKVPTAAKDTMSIGIARNQEREIEKDAPSTGYQTLDYFIKGWLPGHLYIFTGETNVGKSAAACNFLYRAWRQDKKVAYFALEPDVGVIEYLAAIHHRKQWNQLQDEDLLIDLDGMSIFTKDANLTLDKLVRTIETMPRQDLIIVDHIGYFTSEDGNNRSKTEQESNAVKRIIGAAKSKKSAVMIIAHPRKPINTSKKDRPLTMNDISGSAAFKQDGTDIMILHREKSDSDGFGLTNSDKGSILLPKVKTGRSGVVRVMFVPNSPIMLDDTESAEFTYNRDVEPNDAALGIDF